VDAATPSREFYSTGSFPIILPSSTRSNLAAKLARMNSVESTELFQSMADLESREVEKNHPWMKKVTLRPEQRRRGSPAIIPTRGTGRGSACGAPCPLLSARQRDPNEIDGPKCDRISSQSLSGTTLRQPICQKRSARYLAKKKLLQLLRSVYRVLFGEEVSALHRLSLDIGCPLSPDSQGATHVGVEGVEGSTGSP
jgi:hypothetical protein